MEHELAVLLTELVEKVGLLRRDLKQKGDAEKYEARHVIRPYRLHVLLVPALRVAADVLRGSRRYPMSFDWLLPAGVYAPVT